MNQNSLSVLNPSTLVASNEKDELQYLKSSFSKLDQYLDTWRSENGLNGIISTWWASTLDTITPHPMNQSPYIISQLLINSKLKNEVHLNKARVEVESIMKHVTSNGLLSNGYGDVPGAPLAPVIGFSAVGALYAFVSVDNQDEILSAADSILLGYEKKYADKKTLKHTVSNQNARWALTKLQRYLLLKEDIDLENAHLIACELIKNQSRNPKSKGAIHQSNFSDTFISVYGGKCIYPLVSIYLQTGDEKLLSAAKMQVDFLLSRSSNGLNFFPAQIVPMGSVYKMANFLSRIERKVGKKSDIFQKIRRHMASAVTVSLYPEYVARAADTIRGIGALANVDESYKNLFVALRKQLINQQYVNGGFPNSANFYGLRDENQWQDVLPSCRWNVYVQQLLAESLVNYNFNKLDQESIDWPVIFECGPEKRVLIDENEHNISIKTRSIDSNNMREVAFIDKQLGVTRTIEKWSGTLSGARSIENMKNERIDFIDNKL